ncbi:NADH-FMN oxidoreductase RutF, flavin reductase (DIM6/NTAB) family [Nocardioides terrae]|uniref:NADH-FMN oxidoreductase RutF, flavin reductase (DIM6/NTAB) family n=1 Tax=Nocardioides terrae TaxID=574651 RepID=A0A1I1N7I4_9ACTN|nr:flavin reductase family protein [Nocardioides terrae]SFC93641.1 NADH-FMN oxidoreductase RutF, flavin reductase (DIM6/NTAB) family [Nocardioides terrae]
MSSTPLTHTVLEPKVLYFGTPVSVISSLNPDGTTNIAPISSSWYLGRTVVLGIGTSGQTLPNLARERSCVINLPAAEHQPAVERLAPLTGRSPVPPGKREQYRYEPDKFTAAGLTCAPSDLVTPARVAEFPVHLEATVAAIHEPADDDFAIVEAHVVRVHVATDLVVPGTQYVDTDGWRPLMYVFRHYFELGSRRGRNFRADQ